MSVKAVTQPRNRDSRVLIAVRIAHRGRLIDGGRCRFVRPPGNPLGRCDPGEFTRRIADRLRSHEWQMQCEPRAHALGAHDLDVPREQPSELAGDRQAEPCPTLQRVASTTWPNLLELL